MPTLKQEQANRAYKSTQLPLFKPYVKPHPHEAVLLTLYNEIGNNWRMLTDVRFKLLGLVPAISGVLLVSLLSMDEAGKGLSSISRIFAAGFGLIITIAIFLYDRRNSELYDDLISRARRIEVELGMDTGQFLGRKSSKPLRILKFILRIPVFKFKFRAYWRYYKIWRHFPWKPNYWFALHEITFVQHDVATTTIYLTTMLSYLLVILLIGAKII
ncbi:MAG: hypothetical protein LCI00_22280 [Chloroflexi bacterium]|nr:hypothetical protein [Chloroflexota bacterium]MCC6895195.1 hypothetical protein [Anaerolineae bacterium]